jgi:hypothetical protein
MVQYGDSIVYYSRIGDRHLRYPGKLLSCGPGAWYQVYVDNAQLNRDFEYRVGPGQGFTLVHFSAQPEPFPRQITPQKPPDTPYHLLKTP